MKSLTLFLFLLTAAALPAQQEEQLNTSPFLFSLSAGSHLNLYQWQGVDNMPFNVQAQLLYKKRYAFGLGYTYDSYLGDNFFFNARIRPGYMRQNITFRYLNYFQDADKVFSTYIGCSAGLSYWHIGTGENTVFPTAQFLYGMRLKIYRGLFWIHEFGIGPPFLYQSSLGIRF